MESSFARQSMSDHLSGKKILVTGASGFIGKHLCRELIKRGCKIHAVSRKERDSDCRLSKSANFSPISASRLMDSVRM